MKKIGNTPFGYVYRIKDKTYITAGKRVFGSEEIVWSLYEKNGDDDILIGRGNSETEVLALLGDKRKSPGR